MLDKYRPNFHSLTEDEAVLVASSISDAVPDSIDGTGVFDLCQDLGMDQASVVMSMARTTTAVGVSALEKLVGQPIQRASKAAQAARTHQRSKQPRPVLRDDRVIRVLVDSNPKKPGSATYARFELYEDGMTVQSFRERGGKPDDIKWDAERGFIRVEDAT